MPEEILRGRGVGGLRMGGYRTNIGGGGGGGGGGGDDRYWGVD